MPGILMFYNQVRIKYFNAGLNIGLEDIRKAWLLTDPPQILSVTVHQGHLTYRLPGSGKRISYRQLKKGLVKKEIIYQIPCQVLPF